MNQTDFSKILDLIMMRTGIQLPDTNHKTVIQFVKKRLASLQMPLPEYLSVIQGDSGQWADFIDAVTINETYFFREEKQFKLVQRLLGNGELKSPLRAWSASCATGEEAVSLGLLFSEYKNLEWSVFASDISQVALDSFKSFRFSANSLRKDGQGFHALVQKHTQPSEHNQLALDGALGKRFRIQAVNLNDLARENDLGPFELIFFRNTLIYMPFDVRGRIITNLVSRLSEGGFLFLSSTEMPFISHHCLKLREDNGVYYFEKQTVSKPEAPKAEIPAALPAEKPPQPAPRPAFQAKASANQVLHALAYCRQLSPDDADPGQRAAYFLLDSLDAVNSQDGATARDAYLKALEHCDHNELTHWMAGRIALAARDAEAAMEHFTLSLSQNAQFWPSRFQKAMMLARANPAAAAREFRQCLGALDEYIAGSLTHYDSLTEGFNAQYFRQLCGQWLAKTQPEN